jgi:hypothetical protein
MVTIRFPDASEPLARSSVVKVMDTRDEAIALAHERIHNWLKAAEVNGACHLFSIMRASARTGHTHVELELPPHYFGSGGYSLPIERTILRPSRVTMMTDFLTAKIRSHRRNIQRYSRLLATSLSELERQYLHKRIADEQAELERWEMQSSQSQHAAGTPPVENDSGAAGAA